MADCRLARLMSTFTNQTGTANPFNGIDVGIGSAPSFADIDGDGDLDAVVGEVYGTLKYFKNTGSSNNPSYVEQTGTANPFNGIDVGEGSTPSLADIDGDGDLDAVVGEILGNLNYFKNTGSATNPSYAEQIGTANPFNGIDVRYFSAPSFADIDGDGDLDAVVGEEYGFLKYFKNTGSATNPSYAEQIGTANPFDGIFFGLWSAPSFADIDGDGDLDAVVGERGYIDEVVNERLGTLKYCQNTGSATNPSYIEQTGTANPFNGFVNAIIRPSFADIDGDGDPDAIVGAQNGNLSFLLNVVCFLPGTLIATPTGERPIETLQPGDLITTAAGPQPVKFISRTTHFAAVLDNDEQLPIRIAAAAFGELGPVRDLYVSPGHAILLDGHLIHASVLVNGTTITRTTLEHWRHLDQPIEYLNIELEQHQLITAEGLSVESYVDNLPRCDWDNYAAYLTLYGKELPIPELQLPRVAFKRQLPSAMRQRLQQLESTGRLQNQLVAAGS
ncbi:MAG: Hint domain-containing protein [Cyanobium sp. CZS 48M]|nr:Hint domain-containing protein [Cyanobium sp. CZS48M]